MDRATAIAMPTTMAAMTPGLPRAVAILLTCFLCPTPSLQTATSLNCLAGSSFQSISLQFGSKFAKFQFLWPQI